MKNSMMNRREIILGRRPGAPGLQQLAGNEQGATAVEYGLIGGIMAVALIAALPKVAKAERRNLNCVKRAMKGRKANKFCKRRGA